MRHAILAAALAACAREPARSVPPVIEIGATGAPAITLVDPPKPTPGCPAGMVRFDGASIALATTTSGSMENGASTSVTVAPFCLDRTEVTVKAYAECVGRGACERPMATSQSDDPASDASWSRLCNGTSYDRRDHPVNCVSHHDAVAFCRETYRRLPSEAEWELAARNGGERDSFPWGTAPPDATRANLCDASCIALFRSFGPHWVSHQSSYAYDDRAGATAPVGSFPSGATKDGVVDLIGNVSEWTSSEACTYDRARCSPESWIVRGASFAAGPGVVVRTAFRGGTHARTSQPTLGFRCASRLGT